MIGVKKYPVIYADPPWRFLAYSGKGEGRSAVAHYDCMGMDELRAMRVAEIAEDDSVLFLWTTDPFLRYAIDVIKAWGFEFKTVAFYWAKLNKRAKLGQFSQEDFFTGLGYWTRANVEPCLLATRGHPKRISKKVRRLVISPRREHSRKPAEIYERIEELVAGPYIELFARSSRDGWESVGDQVSLFENGSVSTRRFASDLKKYPRIDLEAAAKLPRRDAAE